MSTSSLSSSEAESVSGPNKSSNRVRKLWKNVKMSFLKHGLVEVDGDHPQYVLMECIRQSLSKHIPMILSTDYLTESHYSDVKTLDFKCSIKLRKKPVAVQFTSYAPNVFDTLQSGHGIPRKEFLKSLSPVGSSWCPYYQHKSNSKGKHLFFFTNDKRYLIKFEKEKNVTFFQSNLEKYVEHFIASPHSLVVKILGLYTIRLGHESKPVHFIVMQSVFWPENGIYRRYDLKGCLGGRYEKVPRGVRRSDVVFKDKNFYGTGLRLGNQRDWLMEQISRDVKFLQRLGVMDYSLLVGVCKEKEGSNGESLAELVSSIKRSTYGITQTKKPVKREENGVPQSMTEFIEEFVEIGDDGSVHINEAAIDRIDSRLSHQSFLAEILGETPRNFQEKLRQRAGSRANSIPRVMTESPPPSPGAFEKDVVGRLTTSSKSNRFFQVHPAPNEGGKEASSLGGDKDWEESCRLGILESSNLKEAMNVLVRSTVRNSPQGINTNKVVPFNGGPKAGNPAVVKDSLLTNRIEGVGSRSSFHWQGENRRLLPDNANGIHILEGPGSDRYFLGVIDIFKQYSFNQKLARILKTLIHCSDDHSSAPPDVYANRFMEFIESHLD